MNSEVSTPQSPGDRRRDLAIKKASQMGAYFDVTSESTAAALISVELLAFGFGDIAVAEVRRILTGYLRAGRPNPGLLQQIIRTLYWRCDPSFGDIDFQAVFGLGEADAATLAGPWALINACTQCKTGPIYWVSTRQALHDLRLRDSFLSGESAPKPICERCLDGLMSVVSESAVAKAAGRLNWPDSPTAARLSELRSMPYPDYLASEEWQARRDAARERAGGRCQVCNGDGPILDTHHRTYERLGDEAPGDLIVLCRDCHGIYHQNGRMPEGAR